MAEGCADHIKDVPKISGLVFIQVKVILNCCEPCDTNICKISKVPGHLTSASPANKMNGLRLGKEWRKE